MNLKDYINFDQVLEKANMDETFESLNLIILFIFFIQAAQLENLNV